jgi:hypothetical protein
MHGPTNPKLRKAPAKYIITGRELNFVNCLVSKYSHVFYRLVFLSGYVETKRATGWNSDTVKESHSCRASLYRPG